VTVRGLAYSSGCREMTGGWRPANSHPTTAAITGRPARISSTSSQGTCASVATRLPGCPGRDRGEGHRRAEHGPEEFGSVNVYRTNKVPATQTGGLAVRTADKALLTTLDAQILRGSFLNTATARYPAVVLGYQAAITLGIADPGQASRVWIGDRWFYVVGGGTLSGGAIGIAAGLYQRSKPPCFSPPKRCAQPDASQKSVGAGSRAACGAWRTGCPGRRRPVRGRSPAPAPRASRLVTYERGRG
jgi:hypothetical protein